jgi:hypothetical protein
VPNKQILRGVSLGFYHGAKIGVLGLNGEGFIIELNRAYSVPWKGNYSTWLS